MTCRLGAGNTALNDRHVVPFKGPLYILVRSLVFDLPRLG